MSNTAASTSVGRRALFFAAALAACLLPWLINHFSGSRPESGSATNEIERHLLKNAQLVEYFCLSRIPPVIGKVTIPTEWETALNCDIKLGDVVGELISKSSALTSKAEQAGDLAPGGFVVGQGPVSGGGTNAIIYRSKLNPSFYLLLIDHRSDVSASTGDSSGGLSISILLAALVAAALLTLMASAILAPSRK